MKNNILLLLLTCSLGFSNINGMGEFASTGEPVTDTTIYDYDGPADPWSDYDETGPIDEEINNAVDGYVNSESGSGQSGDGTTSTDSSANQNGSTVDTTNTTSATSSGSFGDISTTETSTAPEEYSSVDANSETAFGEYDSTDPSNYEMEDISEEQLEAEAKEKAQYALDNGSPVWKAIVEWFQEAFSNETWTNFGETIKSSILKAMSEVDGAFTQLAKDIQNEVTALTITRATIGLGPTMGNFILDIFNDIANITEGTTGKNYINTDSYNSYKTSIDAGMTIAEAGQAVSEAATTFANGVNDAVATAKEVLF